MRNLPIGIFLALLVAGGNVSAETVRCSGHIIETEHAEIGAVDALRAARF